MNEYDQFLEKKKHSIGNYGIPVNFMPDRLFDFQKYVTEYVIKKGRCAGFLDTGTGKTIIELVTAVNFVKHTNKPVLILTPLAVAFQFLKEAEAFGIDDVSYSKDGKYKTKIVITNYERLHYFDCSDFECVICDESSCIKNCEGATRAAITIFLRKVKYRFLFTATPSPNDFTELGTSSEALGYLGYTDMLTKFFTNNEDTISPQNIGTEWILKGHAKDSFFKWVSGWSISMRKPSDLGFSDDGFILPELIINDCYIKNKNNISYDGQMTLFNKIAKGTKEVRHENRTTIDDRCKKAAELCENHEISVVWCNLNDEGKLLESLIPNSINMQGSDSLEKKEETILWFIGEKCICKSTHFNKHNVCGKQNMLKKEKKNIIIQKKNVTEEKTKEELLMKIKSTWLNITQITETSSSLPNLGRRLKIKEEEAVMRMIQIIEINAKEKQLNMQKEIQIKYLIELLDSMVLLLSSIERYILNNKASVQFVNLKYPMMEKAIDYLSTTAITQIELGDYYAQNVISDSGSSMTTQSYLKEQQCTCGYKSGIRRLISKTKICGFGLNFQHCNHTVYFPDWSYEKYYQAIRRFWRFGQKRKVYVDLVVSDGQVRVMDSLIAKSDKANQLFSKLNSNLHTSFDTPQTEFDKQIILPSFLKQY